MSYHEECQQCHREGMSCDLHFERPPTARDSSGQQYRYVGGRLVPDAVAVTPDGVWRPSSRPTSARRWDQWQN